MSQQVFDRVLDEMLDNGIGRMALTSAQGEPLLNPDAGEFIEKALDAGLLVEINTNCTTLGKSNVAMLAKAALSGRLLVQASFSGYDRESHESVYVGSDFENTSKKLKSLYDAFVGIGHIDKLSINGIVTDAATIARHKNYLFSIGIIPNEYYLTSSYMPMASVQTRFHNPDNFAGIVPNGRPMTGETRLCMLLALDIIVYDDGKVSACACRDSEGVMEIGDITTQGFAEMRNGDKFQSMLNAHMHHDLSGLPLCSKCDIPYYGVQ